MCLDPISRVPAQTNKYNPRNKVTIMSTTELDIIENVDNLSDQFVRYESAIRQCILEGTTLTSRKRKLIQILKREAETGIMSPMVFHMPLEADICECQNIFSGIESKIRSNRQVKATELEVQLIFLRERLERLAASPNPEVNNIRSNYITRIEELERRFVDVAVASGMAENSSVNFLSQMVNLGFDDSPPSSSTRAPANQISANAMTHSVSSPNLSFEAIQSGTQSQSNHGSVQPTPGVALGVPSPNFDVEEITPPTCLPVPNPCQSFGHSQHSFGYNPPPKMWTWRVRFSGDDRNELASSFLQKITDIAKARQTSEAALLNGMAELLTGTASNWFRTSNNEKPFGTFKDFCTRLLEDFEPHHRVDSRLQRLRKRFQQTSESVVAFFAYVENEFQSMSHPPSVEEQIRIVRKNLLPVYIHGLALRQYTSLSQLKRACREIEVSTEIVNTQLAARGAEGQTLALGTGQTIQPAVQNQNIYGAGQFFQPALPYYAPNVGNPPTHVFSGNAAQSGTAIANQSTGQFNQPAPRGNFANSGSTYGNAVNARAQYVPRNTNSLNVSTPNTYRDRNQSAGVGNQSLFPYSQFSNGGHFSNGENFSQLQRDQRPQPQQYNGSSGLQRNSNFSRNPNQTQNQQQFQNNAQRNQNQHVRFQETPLSGQNPQPIPAAPLTAPSRSNNRYSQGYENFHHNLNTSLGANRTHAQNITTTVTSNGTQSQNVAAVVDEMPPAPPNDESEFYQHAYLGINGVNDGNLSVIDDTIGDTSASGNETENPMGD